MYGLHIWLFYYKICKNLYFKVAKAQKSSIARLDTYSTERSFESHSKKFAYKINTL